MTPEQILVFTLTWLFIMTIVLIGFRINKPVERAIEEKKKQVHPLFIDLYELDAEIEELISEESYSLN